MIVSQYKIFFDTSVYIAALISPQGAAGELIRLSEAGMLRMVVSQEVIIEADRVLTAKFPELIQEGRRLWKSLSPAMAPDPMIKQIKPFLKVLPKADAAILCSAHLAKVSAFVTWNTRDFMGKHILALVDFPIIVPAGGLELFRKWVDQFVS